VHGAVGSVYGCDLLTPIVDAGIIGVEDQSEVCEKWGFSMKEMYRKNRLTMRTGCSYEVLNANGEAGDLEDEGANIGNMDCGWTCNDSEGDFERILSEAVGSKYTGSLTDEQKATLTSFVCDGDAFKIILGMRLRSSVQRNVFLWVSNPFFGCISGDQIESASPADPSFWPIHPTLERALQARLMAGFSDMTWPTMEQAISGEKYVCDKVNCYENGVQDTYEECCYGHYENDQLLDFVNGDKTGSFGQTNKEVLAGTDPSVAATYTMPYIYAHFQWDHCQADIVALIDKLAAANSESTTTTSS
jgi:hypothetical protein